MPFFQNTCKPKGAGGKLMVRMMNAGHASLAKWGLSHVNLRSGGSYLDIGCGGGANLKRLLQKDSAGHVTGIDYSEVSVRTSRQLNRRAIRDGRCEVFQENVMALPFPDVSFDAVTAFETIYFWPDLRTAFRQVYRVLSGGGTFLICNESDGESAGDEKWTDIIQGMRIYTLPQIKEALEDAGFTEIRADQSGNGWLCMVCRKK